MWIVVAFDNDNSVAVVPLNWFKDGFCAWPKITIKNRGHMIEMKTEPTRADFDRFPARLLSSSPIKSLKEAKEKALKGKMYSDLSSAEENTAAISLRRKKRMFDNNIPMDQKHQPQSAKKKYLSPPIFEENSSSTSEAVFDDTDEDASWTPKKDVPQPITSPNIDFNPTSFKQSVFDKIEAGDRERPSASTSSDHTFKLQDSSNHTMQNLNLSDDTDFKTYVKLSLTNLKYEMKMLSYGIDSIKTIVQCLDKNASAFSIAAEYNLNVQELIWPISNSDQLNNVEMSLTDPQVKKNEVELLARNVGKTISESVRRMMSRMFEDAFLQNYSFLGFKGKKKFFGLNCCQLLFDAIRKEKKFMAIPDHEISSLTARWLAQAKNRLTKKKKTTTNETQN